MSLDVMLLMKANGGNLLTENGTLIFVYSSLLCAKVSVDL